MKFRIWSTGLVLLLAAGLPAQERRNLKVDDIFSLRQVNDPRISPDGRWVAYTVSTLDPKEDASDTDIYMVPLAGGEAVRLTAGKKPETSPRWSPDGKFLAFLSARDGKKTQVWIMDRRGGEAVRLTDYKASVSSFVWSPDSTRLALVVSDVDPDDPDTGLEDKEERKPKPIVINRLQFKRDGEGYLRNMRRHLHVFDIRQKSSFQVTQGPYDDGSPAWSPDGKWLAFSSNRTEEPDSNFNTDIFLVEARAGQTPRALTTSPGSDGSPVFSPDGKSIAYLAGGDPAEIWYATNNLALVSAEGGDAAVLTRGLDRNVTSPRFAQGGRSLYFLLEDGGNNHLARIPVSGGAIERVIGGERSLQAYDVGARGELVVLEGLPQRPAEVASYTDGSLVTLTRVNTAFLEGIRLGSVQRFKATSADGTLIDGFLTLPPEHTPGRRLPTLLRIHGGPVAQYSTDFNLEWQMFAAHGYAVVGANPRGSSGHGRDFSHAIWADWGNRDFQDVQAAVDHVLEIGVADPARLGVGGWSYGGILTNYVITQTDRFQAAISGSSEVNYLSNYGTDHYQREWEMELGLPWRNPDLWIRLSPFFRVEKIVTPTLILCGADDMNVPLLNSEQLYQALRRLGRTTELVIYPGQSHSIRRPSFQKDRYERYLGWYDRFLKPGRTVTTALQDAAPEATSLLGKALYPPPLGEAARKSLEENLDRAAHEFVENPDHPDRIIWLGRRTAYLGRYREAIKIFSRGISLHPRDFRLYRHRGHRYITIREFDKAVADLTRASELIRGVPDQVEPDGAPNARNIPVSTSHFNIWYHLGLAHYLKGDFEKAVRAWRECMKFSSGSNDRLVATSDWLYMTLRRLKRDDEAARVLEPIRADMEIIENRAYLDRLLFYKGLKTAEELIGSGGEDGVAVATYGYAVGNWHLYNGDRARAKEVFEKVIQGPQWAAFGYIAAEADLKKMGT